MLSQRIRELRVAQGYSQVTLAKRLGVSKQAVSNWENDNIQPSIEMLLRLAQLFSVSTDYLLGRETHGLMNYPFRTALLEIAFDDIGTKKLMAKTASAHMKKL